MLLSAHIASTNALNVFISAIFCFPPIAPQNGFVNCSGSVNVNAVCRFNCYFGYKLVGNQSIQCDTKGKWIGKTPTCIGKSKMNSFMLFVSLNFK